MTTRSAGTLCCAKPMPHRGYFLMSHVILAPHFGHAAGRLLYDSWFPQLGHGIFTEQSMCLFVNSIQRRESLPL